MDKKKTKYSAVEKKAYYMGYGAALAGGEAKKIKNVMSNLSPAAKESYKNGLDDGYMKNVQKSKKIKGAF